MPRGTKATRCWKSGKIEPAFIEKPYNNHVERRYCCKHRVWVDNPNKTKPEVNNTIPLEVEQNGGNGLPPTDKSVGIRPTIL